MGKVVDRDGQKVFVAKNGVEVKFHSVSPMALQPFLQAMPAPEPPLVETALGPEPDTDDPAYKRAMAEYEKEYQQFTLDIYIELGTEGVEVAQAEVERIRQIYRKRRKPIELSDSDVVVWISFKLIPDAQEYTELVLAIIAESVPTPGIIAEARDAFRGELAGTASPVG